MSESGWSHVNIVYSYLHLLAITPSEQTLPARLNMELIVRLQEVIHPDIFEPKGVYDGRKNMFSIRRYPFENDTRTVCERFTRLTS